MSAAWERGHLARDEWPYIWRWRCRLPERKGQRCRVLIRGGRNTCLVEFPDGARYYTSRWAVRRV